METHNALPGAIGTKPEPKLMGWAKRVLADPAARKTLLCLFDQAVISGAGFATSILIGRYGSTRQLGLYYLALTVILIARGIQAELVTAPYTIFRPQFQGKQSERYSGSILVHQILILGASSLLFLGAAIPSTLGIWRPNLAPTLWVLTLVAPLLLFREFVRNYSFSRMDVVSATLLDVAATVTQLLGLVWLWRQYELTSPLVYVVLGAANAWAIAVWWIRMRGSLQVDWSLVRGHWSKNWVFARWALASQVVCSCTPFVMPWILAIYHDEAIAGIGAACATLIGLSYMFTTALANLLTPRAAQAYARGGVGELLGVLGRTTFAYATVLGLFSVVVFFAGDLMMQLVYGAEFAGYGFACFLFALSVLINSFSIVAGNGLWALHRPQSNLVGDAATLIATCASAVAFAPSMGVNGAALATLLGVLCGAPVRCLTFYVELRFALKSQGVAK